MSDNNNQYAYTWRRLDKIRATIERLIKENERLVAKLKRFEGFEYTTQQRWDAELRIARKEIEEEVTKQIRDGSRETVTSS